jgi:TIR domain
MKETDNNPMLGRKPAGLRSFVAGEVIQNFGDGRTNRVVVEYKRRKLKRKSGESLVAATVAETDKEMQMRQLREAEGTGPAPTERKEEVLKAVLEADFLLGTTEIGRVGHSLPTHSMYPPYNWHNTNQFRLFISHISADKNKATRLKKELVPFGIIGFVAHEDIRPTLVWQYEIERALHVMDGFVAFHTVGFKDSVWTQQEVGFALGRGIKIISFKDGEDPTGFIGKRQALPRRNRAAKIIASEINQLLLNDPLTTDRLKAAQAELHDTISN